MKSINNIIIGFTAMVLLPLPAPAFKYVPFSVREGTSIRSSQAGLAHPADLLEVTAVGAVDLYFSGTLSKSKPIHHPGDPVLLASVIQFELSRPVKDVRIIHGLKGAKIRAYSDYVWEISLEDPRVGSKVLAEILIDGHPFHVEYVPGSNHVRRNTNALMLDVRNDSIDIY